MIFSVPFVVAFIVQAISLLLAYAVIRQFARIRKRRMRLLVEISHADGGFILREGRVIVVVYGVLSVLLALGWLLLFYFRS